MNRVDNSRVYLDLANDLLGNQISERDLSNVAVQLPPLDNRLLAKLAQYAEEAALSEPRYSWAITRVAYSASNSQNCSIFLQALASWYLGRAANHWGQPKRVASAISIARRRFEKLNEPGWIAACDWQLNALSWTKPNFNQAAKKLEQALEQLERTGFDDFVPHCRLALAYAQILIDEHEKAQENIFISEQVFAAKKDRLNQARCWLNDASSLRRQGKFDEALDKLQKATVVFESVKASLEVAKVQYQVALCHLMSSDDLPKAAREFERAAKLFASRDMDLWQAACISNLGYVHLLTGSLATAGKYFQQARVSFTHHGVLGLLADNLNDSGKLITLRGLADISIRQFKQAMKIHERLGEKYLVAVDIANLGEAYGQLGRYQDALRYLELAAERLESLNHLFRIGDCEKFAALVWILLGSPSVALDHLDKAAICYEESNQKALLSSIYSYRASILFEQGEDNKALDYLKMSLDAAQVYGVRPQAALAKRLFGEALARIGRSDEALIYLKQAYSDFVEMGMVTEQAASLIDLGLYYARTSKPAKSKEAFDDALHLSQGTFSETDWRAYAGLANLAENQGDIQNELAAYRQGITALKQIRYNLWQPALIGSYLQSPSTFIDKAIARAADIEAHQDALAFIEANKSTTLLLQLPTSSAFGNNKNSQKLSDIRAEIGWIQEQMKVSFDKTNPLKSVLQTKQMRAQLIEKMKMYDTMTARLERQNSSYKENTITSYEFNVESFRRFAGETIGKSWIALNYYASGNRLITLVTTPKDCRVLSSFISDRIVMALSANVRTRQTGTPLLQSDMRVLGNLLIPPSVAEMFTPDTHLLLAPHKKLHGIPWAAIQPDVLSAPLVSACIPSVIPSLQSLILLWKRATSNLAMGRDRGLLFGISDFQGIYQPLPYVRDELADLYKLAPLCRFLTDESATWENLVQLHNAGKRTHLPRGLSRFAWLHVASHIFSDTHTGRLSGIALRRGNIWLDQLRDLAPLPPLVTFSACNGIFSYIYEGDEHVSLPTTCLIAGANSVVGSAWPILDSAATLFALTFYEYYLRGFGPALCVALTQRHMIERGEKADNWASFVCVGMP